MAISGDYPSAVMVNGFVCRNCTDVAYAQKNVDPAHPKSGAFGATAASDPTATAAARKAARAAAAAHAPAPGYSPAGRPLAAAIPGRLVDVDA